jgi:hypothetical protein
MPAAQRRTKYPATGSMSSSSRWCLHRCAVAADPACRRHGPICTGASAPSQRAAENRPKSGSSPPVWLDTARVQLVTLAAHQRRPAIYPSRATSSRRPEELRLEGRGSTAKKAFISVASSRGEATAELPVMRRPVEFVINRQTARALRFDMPATAVGAGE